MAKPRRTTSPQRTMDMRKNARRMGANQPFQGGIGQGPGPGQGPSQGMQQCPQGQEPGVNPDTGAQICKPAQPNVSGNVPVFNKERAINPGPASNPGVKKPRGY